MGMKSIRPYFNDIGSQKTLRQLKLRGWEFQNSSIILVMASWSQLNIKFINLQISQKYKNQIMQKEGDNWMPLQSNPEVINPFIAKMGMKTDEFSFQQMLSIEEWALQMIPQPCLGIMMLYQCTPVQTAHTNQQADSLNPANVPKDLFFMKQYAQNACGTIALFHIVLNALKKHPGLVQQNSYLHKFLSNVKDSPAEQKGKSFEKFEEVKKQHKGASQQGQSAVQSDCDSHFITFIQFEGNLWELDGMKKCPVNHGPCTPQEVLVKGSEQIQKYMLRDPDNISFSMIVLAKNP